MPPRSRFTHSKTLLALLLLDAVATMVVFNVVAHFRGVIGHAVIAPLLGPLAALVFAIYLIDGYRARTDMMSLDYTRLHLIAVGSAMLTILLLTFVVLPHGYELQSSRSVIVLSFLILIPLTLSYRRLQRQRQLARGGGRSLLFLGDRAGCEAFRDECNAMGTWQPVIHCPILPPADGKADVLSQPFAEALAEMQSGTLAVEAIVMRDTARQLQPEIAQQLVRLHFQGIPTLTLKQFYQLNWQKVPVAGLDPMWLFQDGFQIAARAGVRAAEARLGYFPLRCRLLLVAAPLIAVAGLAILAGDGRPVIFRQTRIGRNREPFSLLKLRTMKVGSGLDGRSLHPAGGRAHHRRRPRPAHDPDRRAAAALECPARRHELDRAARRVGTPGRQL